jgi:hypothetical protein
MGLRVVLRYHEILDDAMEPREEPQVNPYTPAPTHPTEDGLARLELMVAVVLDRMTAVDPEPDPKAG